jgi:S1-C subfamily serine protease
MQNLPFIIVASILGIALIVMTVSKILSERKQSEITKKLIKNCEDGDGEACASLGNRVGYMDARKYLEMGVKLGSAKAARKFASYQLGAPKKIEYLLLAFKLGSEEARKDILFSKEITDSPERFKAILSFAEDSYEPAMPIVSEYLKQGGCVLKSITESTRWLIRSAELGNKVSQFEISSRYVEGLGVSQNVIEGLAWLYVAEFKIGDAISSLMSNHVASERAADRIKYLEKKISNNVIQMAQERAKVILGLITDGKSTVDSVAQGTAPTVVKNTTKPKSKPKGSGTGSIVSSSGHIVTAAHVINGATYIEVVTPSGTFSANTESVDVANDIAILKIDTTCKDFVEVLHSRDVRLGQSVSTIGFPNLGIQGHSPKVTQGVISSDNGAQNDIRMWQISAPIQPGNSGGPLLDESGNLIGVVVASLSLKVIEATGAVPQNVNYAVKSAYLEPLLNSHKLTIKQNKEKVSQKFEDLVESTKKSIVLVLVY